LANGGAPGNTQRVGFLAVVPGILRDFGLVAAEILAAAGLPENALDNPEGMIPYSAMGTLVQISAERSGTPHFGLLVGQRIGVSSLGLIGDLMKNAPTIGVALRDLVKHQHRHARGAVIYLLTQGDHALFGYAIYQPAVDGSAQITDGAAAAAYNIVREMIPDEETSDLEVLISRARPANIGPYLRYFGTNPHFNVEQTGVLFPLQWLDRPLVGYNAKRRQMLETRVEAFSEAGEYDLVTQLRRTLRVGLLTGDISYDHLASELGIARRTLHRHLQTEGINFRSVLDEVRFEFAQQLLSETRLSISDIGLILRYSDPSIFTRAFIRWSGLTPSKWRTRRNAPDQSDPRLHSGSAPQASLSTTG
jgi:AraC-like DNA-binding protein